MEFLSTRVRLRLAQVFSQGCEVDHRLRCLLVEVKATALTAFAVYLSR